MSTIRLSELPDVDSAQLQNNSAGNLRAQTTYLPGVVDGVTKKVKLSDLAQYRSSGTVKSINPGSAMTVTTNVSSGISFASFSLPGAIFAYVGAQAPDGWLFCDGAVVSRSTYYDLFKAIGVAYGAGDGSSTFKLPDLRGRTPVGLKTMNGGVSSGRLLNTNSGNIDASSLGSSGGYETHTLSQSETPLPSHTHTFSATTTVSAGQQYVDARSSGVSESTLGGNGTIPRAMRVNTSNAASDSTATSHPNLPPLAFLNYIIRY